MGMLLKSMALACIVALAVITVSGCCCCTQFTPGTPGQAASAKDWLHIAQNAMKKENPKAFLISIHGWSADRKVVLPIDGKCRWWDYCYVYPPDKLVYDVYVHDGRLDEQFKRIGFGEYSMESSICKNDDPRIDTWAHDSTEVAAMANKKYGEITGEELPYSGGYTLKVSDELINNGRLTWRVAYYDETSRIIGSIFVDDESGAVLNNYGLS